MIHRRAILIAVLSSLVGPVSFVQRPDFRGTWQLDRRGSEITTQYGLAGLGNWAPDSLYISQTGDEQLIIASRLPGSTPRGYLFDGSTWVIGMEGYDEKILVNSRVRGLSLTSQGGGRAGGESIILREILAIAPTGRALTLEVTTTVRGEAQTNKLLYRRAGGGEPR